MRVLIWTARGAERIPGGHRRQLDETSRYLRRLGVDVEATNDDAPDLGRHDVVHGLGMSTARMRACRDAGVPVAVSTIYWERWYLTGDYDTGRRGHAIKRRLRSGAGLLLAALRGRHVEQCEAAVERFVEQRVVFEMADVLLPNSHLEAAAVRRELKVTTPVQVVPNAVDPAQFSPAAGGECNNGGGPRDLVLCVARFEPHKNQLGLVRALSGPGKPAVVLVGHTHPDHPGYREQCRREAGANVRVLDPVPDEELARLYARAKVHVLPSWYETTGLVSLEAALAGCNVVTTNRGFAREYFEESAWYCNPADPRSIRSAVAAALAAPGHPGLREKILANYTWAHAADATLAGYRRALAPHRRRDRRDPHERPHTADRTTGDPDPVTLVPAAGR